MKTAKTIGIVGGVGPYAGLDLNRKIFDQTIATRDQEHLQVILISASEDISDRTEYLMFKNTVNPAKSIYSIIQRLEVAGADVIGIPCNTAYSPPIFDVLMGMIEASGLDVKVLHMIEEVGAFLDGNYSGIRNVGVLATNGTVYSGVYSYILELHGYRVIYPAPDIQQSLVHQSIYNTDYGIKSVSYPVSEKAVSNIYMAIDHLIQSGSEAIILGCTELPLALHEVHVKGRPLIDPTLLLARALIREAAPHKLKKMGPLFLKSYQKT